MGVVVELVVNNKPEEKKDTPVADVVALLEDMLEKAKAGIVRGVGVVAITETSVLTGARYSTHVGHRLNIIAGCTILSTRLARE